MIPSNIRIGRRAPAQVAGRGGRILAHAAVAVAQVSETWQRWLEHPRKRKKDFPEGAGDRIRVLRKSQDAAKGHACWQGPGAKDFFEDDPEGSGGGRRNPSGAHQ